MGTITNPNNKNTFSLKEKKLFLVLLRYASNKWVQMNGAEKTISIKINKIVTTSSTISSVVIIIMPLN